MTTMQDALRTIIARSPAAASEAIDCLRAIAVKSPIVQQRFDRTVQVALSDPQATFSADERALLAEHVGDGADGTRPVVLSIRLSPDERRLLDEAAQADEVSLSTYIRRRLFPG